MHSRSDASSIKGVLASRPRSLMEARTDADPYCKYVKSGPSSVAIALERPIATKPSMIRVGER
jgi:hypothetical protein